MRTTIAQWFYFWQNVATRFFADGGLYRASALTFTSLLALVPLMVVILGVLSFFPEFQSLTVQVQDFIFANFVPSTGSVVKSQLLTFVEQASQLSTIGTMILIVTAVMLLFTIEQAFNAIWHVRKRRGVIALFMLYWAILTLSPFLIGLSFMLSNYILSLPVFADASLGVGLTHMLLMALNFMITVIVFTILYIAVPNCRVPFRYGLLGGLFAAILFEVVKHGFKFYISHFPTYQVIYGTLATIPVFFIWVYLLWITTLLGAEVSHILSFNYGHVSRKKCDGFSHALRWMGHLAEAQQDGKGLSLLQLVRADKSNYEIAPEEQIALLQKAGFVRRAESGRYFISVDLSKLTLYEFYQSLPWKLPNLQKTMRGTPWQQRLKPLIQAADTHLEAELQLSLADVYSTK